MCGKVVHMFNTSTLPNCRSQYPNDPKTELVTKCMEATNGLSDFNVAWANSSHTSLLVQNYQGLIAMRQSIERRCLKGYIN